MTRLEKFNSFKTHPMHKKIFKSMSKTEIDLCEKFILLHDDLNFHNYAHTANRWYMDSKEKPTHWTDMWAMVFQANVRSEHESKS